MSIRVVMVGTREQGVRSAWDAMVRVADEVGAEVVDRLSADLEELLIVTKYQVVEPWVVLFFRGSRLVGRRRGVPTADEVRAILSIV